MSDSSYLLDPEVEAILQEVAKAPDSVLLRVDRPKELKVLLGGGDTIVRSKTGLSSAERQLLEVHRDEAAYLLRLAYYELARRGANARGKGLVLYPVDDSVPLVSDAQLHSRLHRERSLAPSETEVRTTIDSGMEVLSVPCSSLIDLAALSLRLVPSDSARSYVGSEYMIAGHWHSAESIYRRLIDETARKHIKASFLTGLANALARTNRPEVSRECYRQAVEISSRQTRVLSWLLMSVRTHQKDQARDAVRFIDELWPKPDSEIVAWKSAMEGQQQSRIWSMDSTCTPMILAMLEVAESESARLALQTMMAGGGR